MPSEVQCFNVFIYLATLGLILEVLTVAPGITFILNFDFKVNQSIVKMRQSH
jgi:hypothetical protein